MSTKSVIAFWWFLAYVSSGGGGGPIVVGPFSSEQQCKTVASGLATQWPSQWVVIGCWDGGGSFSRPARPVEGG